MRKQQIEVFVRHLEGLRDGKVDETSAEVSAPRPDRAAMSTLRRALSGEERDILPAYKYLNWYLPFYPEEQKRCVLIAALFADHQGGTSKGTLGDHLADLVRTDVNKRAVAERRLAQLLTAHIDDVPVCLRQIVSLLKGAGVAINWRRLLDDVLHWEVNGERIRREWAYDFWGPPSGPPSSLTPDVPLSEDSPVVDQESHGARADSVEADY